MLQVFRVSRTCPLRIRGCLQCLIVRCQIGPNSCFQKSSSCSPNTCFSELTPRQPLSSMPLLRFDLSLQTTFLCNPHLRKQPQLHIYPFTIHQKYHPYHLLVVPHSRIILHEAKSRSHHALAVSWPRRNLCHVLLRRSTLCRSELPCACKTLLLAARFSWK